jgi:hypothetical protein
MISLSLPVVSIKKPLGYVLYRGKSLFNGKPIVVIATGFGNTSENVKTGEMIQIRILSDTGLKPSEVHSKGEDTTTCNDCVHRSVASKGFGSCYVMLFQGDNQVYRSYQNGSYPTLPFEQIKEVFKDKLVRFGSYGEPVLIPENIVSEIVNTSSGHTGYTHQYKKQSFQWAKKYFMASCDSIKDTIKAKSLGWRTFRVRIEDEPIQKGEFSCPASKEMGKKRTCSNCLSCNGNPTESSTRANVTIIVHGTNYKSKRLIKIRGLQKQKKKYTHLLVKG